MRAALGSLILLGTLGLFAKAQPPSLVFQFDSPPTPACGTTFTVAAGDTISFPVQVSDLGNPSPIVLRNNGLPDGADTNPALPTSAIGTVSTVFTWTPTAGQVGTYFITFGALNMLGARVDCEFTIVVTEPPPPPEKNCSFTQGGWGSKPSGNNPGALLASVFATAYPSGVEIGIPGPTGFSLKFTSASAIKNYLPAGGSPKALTGDSVNPTSSKGVFSAQVLALRLNVDLSGAGLIPDAGPLGSLHVCHTGKSKLDGATVAEVLAAAEKALGGGSLSLGFSSISSMNDFVTNLNEAFDDCHPSCWADAHFCP